MSNILLDAARKLRRKGWRRRYPRYRTDIPLNATVLRDDGYADLQGRCGDIGEGGLGAVLTLELSEGEVASLTFRLPGRPESVTVRAIVRYRKGLVHGFEFLGLSAEQKAMVMMVCDSLKPAG